MSDGRDAGRLVAFALQPKVRPAREPEYEALLRQYRLRGDFRALVDAVAEGMGLRVLHAGDLGMVLAVEGDGPFALRLSDYSRTSRRRSGCATG